MSDKVPSERRIFVPRLMDASQLNAQENNARNMLMRWRLKGAYITTLSYEAPEPRIADNPRVALVRLWRRRAWLAHLFLKYLGNYDAIFYPGVHAADLAGLEWRRRIRRQVPVIATLEGLVGTPEREHFYTEAAGHPVYCQRVDTATLARVDSVLEMADHIIAISPFLERLGRLRYGDKFSMLPLGVDRTIYHPGTARQKQSAPVVVSAGTVYPRKRPDFFLRLAARFPKACFRWFGGGELLDQMVAQSKSLGLTNVDFAGPRKATELAEEFRNADIFILTAHSEGVPKVTQEAAACGLPVVLFGFYEAPSVIDGNNGFVVWKDEEFFEKLAILLEQVSLRQRYGHRGAEMARAWDWEKVATSWEQQVISVL